jgi:tripartite-type tricarboxylate transporter receptor subunit TctC
LLKTLAGIDIVHVPYRGANFTDVIGGRVTIAFQNAGSMLAVVREGQLRGLAVTSLKRSPNMPEFPTVAESGFPGYEAISWFALLAPAGTPAPIINKVHQEALKVLAQPEMRAKFGQLGLDPVGNLPDELGAIMKGDIDKWSKAIKDAGIKPAE